MSKARLLADLLDIDGDVKKSALDNVATDTGETEKSYVTCLDATTLRFPSDYLPEHLNLSSAILSSSGATGVLIQDAQGSSSGSFTVTMPYAVILGDSISEGHPALHGRLHPNGTTGFDANYQSQVGQLSYHLSRGFNMPFYNHGIGGETSGQVKARWNRDVLGQDYFVADGRGSVTIDLNGQLPAVVYLHVGINDVFLGVPASTIKENFDWFAQSCRDNGIKLICSNIGADSIYGAAREAVAREVNEYLEGEFAYKYPEVELIDYLGWSSDFTYNYEYLKPGMFVDTVHPSKAGYTDFANYILENVSGKVYIESYTLNSAISGPGDFNRITSFTFNGDTYNISGELASIAINSQENYDDPVRTLAISGDATVTVTDTGGTNDYTGFAGLWGNLKQIPAQAASSDLFQPVGTSPTSGSVVGAGVIYQGALSDGWNHFGITNVDVSNVLTTGEVQITFSEPVTHLVLNMVGTNQTYNNAVPTWSSGAIPNGQTTWSVYVRDDDSWVPYLNANYHTYQVIAFGF